VLPSAGFTRVGAIARAPNGQAAAAACVPSCLVGCSTPDAVYRTIRNGDGGEDAYMTCSAAVRLQAAARGLLARRRVGRLLDLQLIQPCTPSQFLQAVRRHTKAATTAVQLQAVLRLRRRRAAS
jgi:hypothetical protein